MQKENEDMAAEGLPKTLEEAHRLIAWHRSRSAALGDKLQEASDIIAASRRTGGTEKIIKGFELVDCGTCGCQVSLPVDYAEIPCGKILTWQQRVEAQAARTPATPGDKEAAMLDEIAELRASRRTTGGDAPQVHQWRPRQPFAPWHDATREEAYSRVDEFYEARTIYLAAPVSAGQAVQVAMPDDWALVPRKMTPQMAAALSDGTMAGGWMEYAEKKWAAMLTAAPFPPVVQPYPAAPASPLDGAMPEQHEDRLKTIRELGGPAMVYAVQHGKISINEAAYCSIAAQPAEGIRPMPRLDQFATLDKYKKAMDAYDADMRVKPAPAEGSALVALTDSVIIGVFAEGGAFCTIPQALSIGRAIEAKLASRFRAQGGNTPGQQEPGQQMVLPERSDTPAGPRPHDDPELVAVAKRFARQNPDWSGAQIEAAARAEFGERIDGDNQGVAEGADTSDKSKPCRNVLMRAGYSAVPKSCPRCGLSKECPAGHAKSVREGGAAEGASKP